ncbi:hypothetical protein EYF80_039176 [Liparis tanakae]|uniref:Uncharacterized protein n=1 Tax=Liparis tanakae TaxID=230148 RepID=A0A4Z2GD68_9TELE|nr:hypothetical protein EYF80_039176 [Liparis tanakae]
MASPEEGRVQVPVPEPWQNPMQLQYLLWCDGYFTGKDLHTFYKQPALCLLTELLRGRESVCGPMPSLEVNFILFRQQLHLDEDTRNTGSRLMLLPSDSPLELVQLQAALSELPPPLLGLSGSLLLQLRDLQAEPAQLPLPAEETSEVTLPVVLMGGGGGGGESRYLRKKLSCWASVREASSWWSLAASSSFHSFSLLASWASRAPSPLCPSDCMVELGCTWGATVMVAMRCSMRLPARAHEPSYVTAHTTRSGPAKSRFPPRVHQSCGQPKCGLSRLDARLDARVCHGNRASVKSFPGYSDTTDGSSRAAAY